MIIIITIARHYHHRANHFYQPSAIADSFIAIEICYDFIIFATYFINISQIITKLNEQQLK